MSPPFDPYYEWLGIAPKDQPPNHYRLLALELFESNADVIDRASDRIMAFLKTQSGGKQAELSQRLLNEVSSARLCLLNPQKKAAYDQALRQKLSAMPPARPLSATTAVKTDSGDSPTREFRPAPTKAKQLGEYTLIEKIGAGGMGQVFKAEHRRMKRIVALKVLPPTLIKSPDAIKRFYREVEAAARLSHPNIVTAYDASEQNGIHYLVMEFVDGLDLSQLVKQRGPLPIEQAVDFVVQAARGLQYAHGEGIVHRDIKPANLLVDKKGIVKVLDMGLARIDGNPLHGPTDGLTNTGQVIGTMEYMSPVQAEETHGVDHRADIYSLGCTLYRLLTGEVPFHGDTVVKTILAHREAPIPSLCTARSDVPLELDEAFQRMVAKRPDDRFQSMAGVIAALSFCLAPQGAAAGAEASSSSNLSFLRELASEPTQTRADQRSSRTGHDHPTRYQQVAEDTHRVGRKHGAPAFNKWIAVGAMGLALCSLVAFRLIWKATDRKFAENQLAQTGQQPVKSRG